jgi:hypothetical protein
VVIDDAGLKKESEIAAAHVELLAVPSFFTSEKDLEHTSSAFNCQPSSIL